MALITTPMAEDANSYVTVDELFDFAELRGEILGFTDREAEQALIKAMDDYLESSERDWANSPTSEDQALAHPRNGEITIHPRIKKAQMLLAIEVRDADIAPSNLVSTGGAIIKEKLDGVGETTYSDEGRVLSPYFTKVEGALRPFYNTLNFGVVYG